jgi:nucleotide-binding universal stress UspA family protein
MNSIGFTIRKERINKMRKILIPVDGSAASVNAAKKAIEFARQYGSELTFLSVFSDSNIKRYEHYDTQLQKEMEKITAVMMKEEEQILDSVLKDLNLLNIIHDKKVVQGEPSLAILSAAAEGQYDLIIMGRRGFSRIKRLFVGSVTQRVISEATCPVLVVQE